MVVAKKLLLNLLGDCLLLLWLFQLQFLWVFIEIFKTGKVGEALFIGFILLILAIHYGSIIAADPIRKKYLHLMLQLLAIYNDGLWFYSLFYQFVLLVLEIIYQLLKIGVILLMAIAIVIVVQIFKCQKWIHNILMEVVLFLEHYSPFYLLLLLVVLLVVSIF